jgi:hypothetical protein
MLKLLILLACKKLHEMSADISICYKSLKWKFPQELACISGQIILEI